MPTNPSVDGVIPASPEPAPLKAPAPAPVATPEDAAEAKKVKTWKFLLSGMAAFVYMIFIAWCGLLLLTLPAQEDVSSLVMIGVGSCIAAALVFIAVGTLMFFHISKYKTSARSKQIALIKLIAVVVPGLLLSAFTPFMITREPALLIDIIQPASAEELVAPISMTFNVQKAVSLLSDRGFRPLKYKWDVNGDKKVDQETLDPEITATFEREGIYTVSVIMSGSDGSTRTATRKFIIRQAVFSVTPNPPFIDKPAVFSLAHLFPDAAAVQSVAWDFDGDGNTDEDSTDLQASYTFLRTGKVTVSATVQLTNKTQISYQRVVDVTEPPPLPFPVTIQTQPSILIGSTPFAALFEVITKEPIYSVQWNFGDGQRSEGTRVTHTFNNNGSYAVQARVRSQSGVIADVGTVVKVVNKLNLNDLTFEGTPELQGSRITGEVPLSLDLRAVTQKPFVTFSWEAPDATEVGSTQDRLQAIYRRPGTYVVTLIGQDLENHVLRQPITVQVLPPSSLITFQMDPESGVAPLSVKFDASESSFPGEDITGFIWNFGDSSPEEFGGAITQHTYRLPGKYVVNVRATTTSGNQQSANKTVNVRAATVQARILASRLSGAAPLTIAFDASPSTGTIRSYLWSFGDGTQNDGKEVQHTFTSPGIYTVQLTVTDDTGKTSNSSITITVE